MMFGVAVDSPTRPGGAGICTHDVRGTAPMLGGDIEKRLDFGPCRNHSRKVALETGQSGFIDATEHHLGPDLT